MVVLALELYWWLKAVHSLARSQGSLPPVFHVQTRDLLKITQITRQHQGIMLEGNGGNLEVHCPNTHPLLSQTLKGHRRAGQTAGLPTRQRTPRGRATARSRPPAAGRL